MSELDPRRVAATLAVVALLLLTGCIGQFGVGISNDELDQNRSYSWEENATIEEWPEHVAVQIEISQSGLLGSILGQEEYHAIYTGNRTQLTLSERGFTRPHAVDIRAVRYQYPNGTIVGPEAIDVSQSARRTRVVLPEGPGRFAFTGDRRNKEVHVPAVADGNYTLTLPANYRVGDLVLSDVSPGGYDTESVDGKQRIRWSGVDDGDELLVRFYHERDWYIFYGMIAVLSLVGVGVFLYYRRQIREIQRWRAAQGLDLDLDDDEEDRPPPGMG